MAAYFPVLIGEAEAHRAHVEAYASCDLGHAMTEGLAFLDNHARNAGRQATFGAEIECIFVPDPSGIPHRSDRCAAGD
jgi:hypothetical protein